MHGRTTMTAIGRRNRRLALVAGFSLAAMISSPSFAETKIDFYYPVQVGGPVTQISDGYIKKFEEQNPDIDVNAVYSGNYNDTTTKTLTAAKSANPPAVAVLLATDIFMFLDEDVVDPIDDYVKSDEDKAWLAGFMPAYLKSAQVDGK